MKFIIIPVIILSTLNLLLFKSFGLFLLNSNFSWTLSKAFPYLSLIIFGFYISYWIKKNIKLNKTLLLIFQVIFLIAPFAIGFILHPIYEGDFSKNGIVPKFSTSNEIKNYDLIVLTIPGCPFCHESVINSNFMLKRNPKIKIKYILCSTEKKELGPYRIKLDKKIDLVLAKDPNKMASIAQGKFPSFILNSNNKPSHQWSNNEFGVRAKDMLENEVSK